MDSALSKARSAIECLKEAARRGDWRNACEMATHLRGQALPVTREELAAYLKSLKEALIVAKASRAQAAASLVRLNAAAGFHRGVLNRTRGRQNFGESTDFERPKALSGE